MTTFQTIAVLLTGTAIAGYINHRVFKLPSTIGLMVFSLLLSVAGLGLNRLGLIDLAAASQMVRGIDFSELFLHGFLSFLLFAGALHIDLEELRRVRVAVGLLASIGVVISALATSGLVWFAAQVVGRDLPYVSCFMFGALIAPTDPIAVLSLLRTIGVPKRFYARIGGEALFNDGFSIILFMIGLEMMTTGQTLSLPDIGINLLHQVLGGAVLGLCLGWLTHQMISRVDDYKIEILLTLALATGGYALAESLLLSAPIAMAGAGLVIGHHRRISGQSGNVRKHLDLFWELLDEVLHAVLFLLMGLVLVVIPMTHTLFMMGLLALPAVLIARYVSVAVPIGLIRLFVPIAAGTIRLLAWGGLRGGLSIAMALSLPEGPQKNLLLAMTYVVVVFSIIVQGLTFPRLAQKFFS